MPRPSKKAQAAAEAAAAAAAAAAAVVTAPKPVAPAPPAVAAAPAKPAPVIDVENFIRVRDSVYQRLSTIQDLIKSFSQDYLRQTNLLLGEGTSLEGVDFSNQDFGFGQFAQFVSASHPAVEEKKERKKRTHDPNAPKRPLTPYFLYMQTARPIIAGDLGEEAPKGAVQEEGQRRWAVMDPNEKAGWNTAYKYNLRLYNARVHSYKMEKNPNAKDMNDDEALKYANEHNIELPTSVKDIDGVVPEEADVLGHHLHEVPAEVSEEEPTPTTKTPKKKEVRRRKTATPATATEPEPKAMATPSSPEIKKRKRASKVADVTEEPKKSGRKKTKTST